MYFLLPSSELQLYHCRLFFVSFKILHFLSDMSEYDDYVELSQMLEMALGGNPEPLVDETSKREEIDENEIVEDEGDYVELMGEQTDGIISDPGKEVEQKATYIKF